MSKTNFIVLQTRRNEKVSELMLVIRKAKIYEVGTTIFLGIDTDSSLTWKKATENCNKISSNLFRTKRLSCTADLDDLYTAYYRLVCLYHTYGSAVWDHSCKNIQCVLYCKKGQSYV
jgi:hypothetical protein